MDSSNINYYFGNRRLRLNPLTRELTREVVISRSSLVQPLFLVPSLKEREAVVGMKNIYRDNLDSIQKQIDSDLEKGQNKFLMFCVPEQKKDHDFSAAFSEAHENVLKLKNKYKDQIWLAVDVCLCSSTTHGHCGTIDSTHSYVENNNSVNILTQYALSLAQAGADCVAPSDMMDGRIASIRRCLDQNNLDHILLWSYAVKFNSSFYGPFRNAASSAPKNNSEKLSNRASYQLDPSNVSAAFACAERDLREGADMLMVKPALAYLDILKDFSTKISATWSAYQVSGEYTAIELLAENGLAHRERAHLEAWISLYRAGARIVVSYASRDAKEILDHASWF